MKFIIALITFSLSFCLLAKECEYVNLIEAEESPFNKKIPVYYQGELATCYAYTASQIVDYYQFSHGKELGLTNALWTAFIHKIKRRGAHWSPDSFNYSLMEWTLEDLGNFGICRDEEVKKSMLKVKHGAVISDDELMYFFHELWDAYHTIRKKHIKEPKPEHYQKAFDDTVAKMPETARAEFQKLKKPLHQIIRFTSKNARMDFLRRYVFSECNGDAIYFPDTPKVKSSGRFWPTNKKIAKTIHNSFKQEIPQPVGVGYCSHILEHKYDTTSSQAMEDAGILPRILRMAKDQKSCSPHYSVFAGQRSGKGKSCDYLIRNTYGTDFWTDKYPCMCERYNEGVRELYDCNMKDQLFQGDKPKVLGCWVDGDDVLHKIFDVNYFKE